MAIPVEGKLKPALQNEQLADASDIEIAASGFDGNLTTGTVNVQQLAQAVDDLVVSGGTPPVPSLHSLTIDIASRVDLNTDLNVQHTINFDVTNYSGLTALELTVTSGTNISLTLPTSDGPQSRTITLAGIVTSSQTTVTFQLTGTYSGGSVTSNIVTVNVQDLQTHEFAYYGAQVAVANFDTVDVSNLFSSDVSTAATTYTFSVSVPNGQFLGILSPNDRDPTSIIETTLNTESLSDFTAALAVRTINSVTYNLLTIQNNSGFTGTYSFRVTTE